MLEAAVVESVSLPSKRKLEGMTIEKLNDDLDVAEEAEPALRDGLIVNELKSPSSLAVVKK